MEQSIHRIHIQNTRLTPVQVSRCVEFQQSDEAKFQEGLTNQEVIVYEIYFPDFAVFVTFIFFFFFFDETCNLNLNLLSNNCHVLIMQTGRYSAPEPLPAGFCFFQTVNSNKINETLRQPIHLGKKSWFQKQIPAFICTRMLSM